MERRQYPRFKMNCNGVTIERDESHMVDVVDISEGGALLKCNNKIQGIENGEDLKFSFFDSDSDTVCNTEAIVVRNYEENGSQFIAVSYKDASEDVKTVVENKEA